MLIPLSTRFQYENYDLKEIDLPLRSITPLMAIKANREMTRRGIVVPMNKIDQTYCTIIASYLTKIPEAVLMALPYEDWDAVTAAVQYFLLQSREPETELPETSDSTDILYLPEEKITSQTASDE